MPSEAQMREHEILPDIGTYGREGPIKLMYAELIGKPEQILKEAR